MLKKTFTFCFDEGYQKF